MRGGGGRREWGATASCHQFSFWGDENVSELKMLVAQRCNKCHRIIHSKGVSLMQCELQLNHNTKSNRPCGPWELGIPAATVPVGGAVTGAPTPAGRSTEGGTAGAGLRGAQRLPACPRGASLGHTHPVNVKPNKTTTNKQTNKTTPWRRQHASRRFRAAGNPESRGRPVQTRHRPEPRR